MKNFLKKYKIVLILVISIIFCLAGFVLFERKDKEEAKKIKEVENVKNQEINNNNDEKIELGGGFFKEKNIITFSDSELSDVDVNSFQVIGNSYAKDKSSIFFCSDKLDKIDYNTFQILNGYFVKDKNGVYFADYREKIKDLNANDTISFGENYIGDKNNVYIGYGGHGGPFYEKLNKGVNIKTFKQLSIDGSNLYAKDKNFVYNYGKKIIEKDVLTFEILDDLGVFTRDKNGVYRYNEKIKNVDNKTFQCFSDNYCKDKSNIYFFNSGDEKYIILNVDLESFKVLNSEYIKDKNRCYSFGIVTSMSECDKISK